MDSLTEREFLKNLQKMGLRLTEGKVPHCIYATQVQVLDDERTALVALSNGDIFRVKVEKIPVRAAVG